MSRAQSETLGFVFVFALITLTVGTVYALGVPALQDAQDAERTANVERAFEVLDDNIADVTRRGAPSRATEIKLAGGTLTVGGETRVVVEAVDENNASRNASFSVTARPISYRDGDGTTISHAAGAILRTDGDSSVLLSGPGWVNDSDRAVIQLVATYPSSNRTSLGGRRTVLVVTRRESTALRGRFDTNESSRARVNVTVNSTRAGAWEAYFQRRGMQPVPAATDDEQVTYQFTTDTLYVSRVSVGVELAG